MLKKAFSRFLFGAQMGISVYFVVALIISATVGDGCFHPIALDSFSTELGSIVFVTFNAAIYGGIFAAASVLFSVEALNFSLQTVAHFCVCFFGTLPIVLACHWVPCNVASFAIYVAMWLAIYGGIWFVNFLHMQHEVSLLNKDVEELEN